jgi:hemolysin activation/secretion protein
VYLRGDLADTHELPTGMQLYAKMQGQVSDQPLVSAEQFGGGGLGTVRGYLEGQEFGDNAVFGSVELRSPSLFNYFGNKNSDWRVYIFGDAGHLSTILPEKEQKPDYNLGSVGVGSRIRLGDHFNGSIDLGIPLISLSHSNSPDPRVTFRLWGTF